MTKVIFLNHLNTTCTVSLISLEPIDGIEVPFKQEAAEIDLHADFHGPLHSPGVGTPV